MIKSGPLLRSSTSLCISILLLALLLSCPPLFAAKGNPPQPPSPDLAVLYDQVIAELRSGGVTVFFVPLDTIGVDQTEQNEWWKDCALSRAISAHGMEQAKAVRRAISQLGFDIQFIESSELCIALSTYTFILPNDRWHRFFVTPALNPFDVRRKSVSHDEVIEAQVRAHIHVRLPDSVKFVFGFPLPTSAAPHPVISDLAAGESAIFKGAREDEPLLVARLNWRQWEEMGNYFASKRVKTTKKMG